MILFKKLLIIGCGRSGTKYISSVLCAMGADMPHEKIGTDGMISWKEAIQPKWKLRLQYSKIYHQVRYPLDVINSCQTLLDESWGLIENHIPIAKDDPLIVKCMKYWYFWNLLSERKAHQTFQLERISDLLTEASKFLDIKLEEFQKFDDKKINSRKNAYHPYTWEDLAQYDKNLVNKCIQLASRYGYEV